MPVPITLIVLPLLLVTAWRDIATRTIPDPVSLLLLLFGALARLLESPSALAYSAATALVLFILLLLGHARGMIGGGDVKVMASLALGLSPFDCYRFVVATTLGGGLLGIAYLLLSRRLGVAPKSERASLLRRVLAIEAWRIRRRGPLPYGVAIAAGGVFVLLNPGSI